MTKVKGIQLKNTLFRAAANKKNFLIPPPCSSLMSAALLPRATSSSSRNCSAGCYTWSFINARNDRLGSRGSATSCSSNHLPALLVLGKVVIKAAKARNAA